MNLEKPVEPIAEKLDPVEEKVTSYIAAVVQYAEHQYTELCSRFRMFMKKIRRPRRCQMRRDLIKLIREWRGFRKINESFFYTGQPEKDFDLLEYEDAYDRFTTRLAKFIKKYPNTSEKFFSLAVAH